MDIGEDIRKILLVGIGAAAETAERGRDIVNELVKKGELTVEQGKVLNEELKHNVAEKVREHVTVTVSEDAPEKAVENMSDEELAALKAKIAEVERKRAEHSPDGGDHAGK